jgi:hypothetical protein
LQRAVEGGEKHRRAVAFMGGSRVEDDLVRERIEIDPDRSRDDP